MNAFRPVIAGLLSAFLACSNEGCRLPLPPGGAELEKAYNAELDTCVDNLPTAKERCYCRLAVEEKYGMCDHPEWPRFGRCDHRCETVK